MFESWTRIRVPMTTDGRESLLGCTVNGELLIKCSSPLSDTVVSLDPQSSKKETLKTLPSIDVIILLILWRAQFYLMGKHGKPESSSWPS